MQLKSLDHVGLKVKDLDASLRFYQRLGLKVLRTKGPAADGLRSAVVQVGSQELNIFCRPEFVRQRDVDDNVTGVDHFCFEVVAASIDHVIADLRGVGIDIVGSPIQRSDGMAVFLSDPDDLRVELQLKYSQEKDSMT